MKTFILFVLVACVYQPMSANAGLTGKSLIFPAKTDKSYVQLQPGMFPQLSAFTVCLRAASEESRNYVLFSYATSKEHNELLIWQNSDGKLSLYLGNKIVTFSLPKINALLRHICVTWEAREGVTTFWVNGDRTVRKVGKKDTTVRGGGSVILGQEQDSVGGRFDSEQSFVGEITDVHVWDRVLTAGAIRAVSQGCYSAGGNIIDWATIPFIAGGNVSIKDNNDCAV
ncbi:serum amyloid P-component-like [Scyliorhinus canicula]|uniref:serum amyloid P-component-like n=1 Tax=Scyliorhinus canicula TaxID=7830 RepID=UPI0018F498E2|nr:serum amyloid P-component-like [Scyliorhinus canicula]